MKRHFTIISLVMATMVFAACQKDDNGLISLNVEVSNYVGGNTKMYVDENNYTHWTKGDQVNINNTPCPVNLDGTNAQITGVEQSASYTAIYPASIVTGTNTICLPTEQAYTVDDDSGNQIIAAPMAAYTEGNTLTFSNLCALIRVDVTPNTNLVMERIIVTSSTTNLCGNGTITFSGTPTLGALDGSKTVTLTFDGTTTVSNGDTKSFYIYVPQFTSDVTVNVQAVDPSSHYKYAWNKTKTDASLSANSIGAVPATYPSNTSKYFFGAGTSVDPFLIYNFDEIGLVSGTNENNKCYKLMKNIDCGENTVSLISTFKGTFDGDNKTITYIISNTTGTTVNLGLFGKADGATIKNLKVSGSITTNCAGGYGSGIGSIVGYSTNGSIIENCYSAINITSTHTGTTNLNYGGIVGYMGSGTVKYCFVSDTINGNGKNRLGGIAAYHTGGTIDNCTFVGSVSGNNYVGMISGHKGNNATVTNCHYYATNTTESYDGVRGIGGSTSTNSTDIAGTIRSSKTDLQTYVGGITGYDVYTSSLSSRLAEL